MEKDRYVYAPYYMKKDWYGLYLAQQGAEEWESWDGKAAAYAAGLTDRLAVYFIQKIMVYRNLDFSELTIEAEGRDSEHPFVLRLGDEYGAFYTADFPAEGEFVPKLEKRLIETAEELAQGKEVELEQADFFLERENQNPSGIPEWRNCGGQNGTLLVPLGLAADELGE